MILATSSRNRASAFYSQQNESEIRGQYFSKTSKWVGANSNGFANKLTKQYFTELFEMTMNYDKDFGGTNLALLGGYSYQDFFNEGFGLQGGNFILMPLPTTTWDCPRLW